MPATGHWPVLSAARKEAKREAILERHQPFLEG